MSPRHVVLAVLVTVIWGLNFVVLGIGLTMFPPLLLTALRFVGAALPVLLMPRPDLSWPRLLALGGSLFVGQFVFLFSGVAAGMPPGLASLTMQSQVFMTILLAAVLLRERPSRRQIVGCGLAVAGLVVIGLSLGRSATVTGFAMTLAAAASWSVGNIQLRRSGPVNMLHLVVWLALIPPLPVLALSLWFEGLDRILAAFAHAGWAGAAVVFYLAVPTTIVAFAIWGMLLRRYAAATVTPFALLVPLFGASSSAVLLGERFGVGRMAGMALILLGLAVVVVPWERWLARPAASSPSRP